MNKILFGELLSRLLYLSNQKKSSLAKELGYDVSYISKWINSKSLPSAKNATTICRDISNFIVNSLTEASANDVLKYFELEIDGNEDKKQFLLENIEKYLKSCYLSTVGNKTVVAKETYEQERYNSINYVNPRLRKRFLTEDIKAYIDKNEVLDIIIYISLGDLSIEEKKLLLTAKKEINDLEKKDNLRIKFAIGLDYTKESLFIDSMIILNMISCYQNLNVEVYDCDIAKSIGVVSIKDKLLYIGIIRSDGVELLINTSKEKSVVNEFYFSTEKIIKSKGNLVGENKEFIDMIKDTTYIQHIISQNQKWILGNISELFMPEDLFNEVAQDVFGEDKELLEELKKINIFLNNITYKSDLKVVIYESGIKRYILSGEMDFFGNKVRLDFEQRSRHMRYLDQIIKENRELEIRIIDEQIIEDLYNQENILITLSDNFKIIGVNTQINNDGYTLVTNELLKNMYEDLFKVIWEQSQNTAKGNESFAAKIYKTVDCMKIVNEKINK